MTTFKKNQIVKDSQGNHFRILALSARGRVEVESVATKEVFLAPESELQPTDREAM